MYQGILSAKIDKATPEFRFFLLTCVRSKVEVIEPSIKTKELAAQFKVGVRTLYRALRFFTESGLFTDELVQTKGRPGVRYRLGLNINFKPDVKIPNPLSLHRQLVDFILFGQEFQKEGRLGLRDRLLLAVLVHYSDECGVVRTLGASDISALTGIGKSGVPGRLEKLRMDGYIRASVPGVNGSFIFQKSKSIHFLDLSHPAYRSSADLPTVISMKLEVNSLDLASRLVKGARSITRSVKVAEAEREKYIFSQMRQFQLNIYQKALMETSKVFMDHPRSGVARHLQVKLEEYAAFVLPAVLAGIIFSTDEALKRQIEDSLVVRSDQDDQLKKTLTDMFVDMSIVTAREIFGSMTERQKFLVKEKTRFAIVPGGNDRQRMLLAASY